MTRLLADGAGKANGRAAVPLLRALARRPVPAAQVEGIAGVIRDHLESQSGVVRVEAARALESILAADYLEQPRLRREAAEALGVVLGDGRSGPADVQAALGALAEVGPAAKEVPSVSGWLRLTPAAKTFAEVEARLKAIAGGGAKERLDEVAGFVETLPLDAPDGTQHAALAALARLDAARAAQVIATRIEQKSVGGMGVAVELGVVGTLPVEVAGPLLGRFAGLPLSDAGRMAFAEAARRVKDGALVPALGTMLDPRNHHVRTAAIEALRAIDTDEAASTLAPHVNAEPDPARRLVLYAFLGKHGLKDGYAFALEQMGMPAYAPFAIEALAAIDEPGTLDAVRKILDESHATSWEAAALRGLGRLGDAASRGRLMEASREGTGPRAIAAMEGLAALGDEEAFDLIAVALRSRGDSLVTAGARAARVVLEKNDMALKPDVVREALARLVEDRDAGQTSRLAALETLDALDDARLAGALRAAVRDVSLEGSDLLRRVEAEMKERKVGVVAE
jgi:hypothetical protein